jgi:P27 family predicted phage terminase small subunit
MPKGRNKVPEAYANEGTQDFNADSPYRSNAVNFAADKTPPKRPLGYFVNELTYENDAERDHAQYLVDNPPDGLTDIGLAEWKRVVPELHLLGHLTYLDATIIASYCNTYALWKALYEAMQIDGAAIKNPNTGAMELNPLVNYIQKVMKDLIMFAKIIGLTPYIRKHKKMDRMPDPKKDKFINFVKNRERKPGANTNGNTD